MSRIRSFFRTLGWLASPERLPEPADPVDDRGSALGLGTLTWLVRNEPLNALPEETSIPWSQRIFGSISWILASEELPAVEPDPQSQSQGSFWGQLAARERLPDRPLDESRGLGVFGFLRWLFLPDRLHVAPTPDTNKEG